MFFDNLVLRRGGSTASPGPGQARHLLRPREACALSYRRTRLPTSENRRHGESPHAQFHTFGTEWKQMEFLDRALRAFARRRSWVYPACQKGTKGPKWAEVGRKTTKTGQRRDKVGRNAIRLSCVFHAPAGVSSRRFPRVFVVPATSFGEWNIVHKYCQMAIKNEKTPFCRQSVPKTTRFHPDWWWGGGTSRTGKTRPVRFS